MIFFFFEFNVYTIYIYSKIQKNLGLWLMQFFAGEPAKSLFGEIVGVDRGATALSKKDFILCSCYALCNLFLPGVY